MRTDLDTAIERFSEALQRMEAHERALAALASFLWDGTGPPSSDVRALRAERRRLVDAAWRALKDMSSARRAVRLTAALAVVRERNFEAAVPLLQADKAWQRFSDLYDGCVETERALLELDLALPELRAEDRAEVVARVHAVRVSLSYARPQLALLPRLARRERTTLATALRDELDRAWHELSGMAVMAQRYGADVEVSPPSRSDKDGDGGRLRALGRRVVRVLSRLFALRGRRVRRALSRVNRASGVDLSTMSDTLHRLVWHDGGVPRPRRGPQTECGWADPTGSPPTAARRGVRFRCGGSSG